MLENLLLRHQLHVEGAIDRATPTTSKKTHADGAQDAKTKELMHLALVPAFRCEP